MRHFMSVAAIGLTIFCFTGIFAIASERIAAAADQDLAFQDGISSFSETTETADGIAFAENQIWTPVQKAGRAIWIVEDFEDGNIDGWVDEGGGACTASTSAVAAGGAYSMRVDGACGHFLGRVFETNGGMPTGVSVWVRSDTVNTNDTYFVLGDNQSGPGGNPGGIYFYGAASGVWSVFYGSNLSCGTRNPNQWYRVRGK